MTEHITITGADPINFRFEEFHKGHDLNFRVYGTMLTPISIQDLAHKISKDKKHKYKKVCKVLKKSMDLYHQYTQGNNVYRQQCMKWTELNILYGKSSDEHARSLIKHEISKQEKIINGLQETYFKCKEYLSYLDPCVELYNSIHKMDRYFQLYVVHNHERYAIPQDPKYKTGQEPMYFDASKHIVTTTKSGKYCHKIHHLSVIYCGDNIQSRRVYMYTRKASVSDKIIYV